MTQFNMVICDDALKALKKIPDETFDCVVTSPPYYNLRNYGIPGQIGIENTPSEYIDKMTDVFTEVYRVLKSTGTLWLNIADSYNGSGKGRNKAGNFIQTNKTGKEQTNKGATQGALSTTKIDSCKKKDLIGIPWLLAFALRDRVGFYLRQDIIWNKPNAMPESVKDRCTRSHEYIFLFSKSPKYYFDYEAIEEPAITADRSYPRGSKNLKLPNKGLRMQDMISKDRYIGFNNRYSEHGARQMKRKRDVWNVSTKGYKDVIATFPVQLITPCILAGCPERGVVLDPFAGSGTVGEVCLLNNRQYYLIELNKTNIPIINERLQKVNNKKAHC